MATTTNLQSGTVAIAMADTPKITQQYWEFLKAQTVKESELPTKEAR